MNCIIFGYGYMGKIRYQVLRQHPDVREVHVCDPAVSASESGLGSALLPAHAPIDWTRYDAAFICTPNNITATLCADAIRHCGHVFCEKPPGRHWDDFCLIMDAAAEAPNHTLVFGFNHRLHPQVQIARSMVAEGGLGKIIYMKGTYGKSGGKNYRESWRNNREVSGGGILLDQGIHMLDIFQTFLGKLTVVDAMLADTFWKCGVEDNAFVLMRSHAGVPVMLHSSATLWKHTFQFEIGCERGYLTGTGLLSKSGSYGREQLVIGKRQFEDEATALGNPREEIIHFDRDESWELEINEFFASIRENRPAQHGTLNEARQVMEIVRDAYQKSELYAVGAPR